jgi:hypothetical protein
MLENFFSTEEILWLNNNPKIAISIEEALEDSENTNPLENGEPDMEPFLRAVAAARITINAAVKKIVSGPYDKLHLEIVNNNIENINIENEKKFWILFSFHCACFNDEDNGWPDERVYMQAMMEIIRTLYEGEFEMIDVEDIQVADLNTDSNQQLSGKGVNARFINV